MATRKRIEITLQAKETFVVRSFHHRGATRCQACAAESMMVTPEEAATASGLSQREIFRQIESGRIHYSETAAGKPLVCLASLTTEMFLATSLEVVPAD